MLKTFTSKANEPDVVAERPATTGKTLTNLGLEHFATDGGGIADVGGEGGVDSNKTLFRAGDVLCGKHRTHFRKHGRPGFEGGATTGLWVLRPKSGCGSATLDATVSRPASTEFAVASSDGTKMPRARWEHVATFPVEVPSADVRPALDASLESIWRAAVGLREEIAELTRIRDELLQLLLSGRVRVRDTVEVVA